MTDDEIDALSGSMGKIKKEYHGDMMQAVQDIARDVDNRLTFIKDKPSRQLVLYEIMVSFLVLEISDIVSCFKHARRERIIRELSSSISRLSSLMAGERHE